jgi:hypothetical protein
MTRTGRALVIGPVVAALALWVTAIAAVPAERTPAGAQPIAAHPPASEGIVSSMMTLPVIANIVGPLVLAAIVGGAMAFFSAEPRRTAKARVPRRRGRS